MFTLHFDCPHIHSRADFYHQLRQQYATDYRFGDSLDALWDWLTGEIPLPVTCYFHQFQPQQLAPDHPLSAIVALFYEAREEEPDLYHIIVEQADSE
ncbi:barstar family protein [Rosenbergiella nectarea]|uniref:barstar family protein n=1 Tax=Rosenbergiella nectarea TaxID=988801 RepID=UPI001BDAE8E2|nr:barstar family protein [Rosenbergiella nectarea]MBT0729161.1 Barstar, RNAse (barnase) inhibitor [Rosenbergiella nectarea subsp. apis]